DFHAAATAIVVATPATAAAAVATHVVGTGERALERIGDRRVGVRDQAEADALTGVARADGVGLAAKRADRRAVQCPLDGRVRRSVVRIGGVGIADGVVRGQHVAGREDSAAATARRTGDGG